MARHPRLQIHLTGPARRDIAAIVKWSFQEFGEAAALRYEALIRQALRDIEADPERPGSKERPDLMIEAARTYHLSFSRNHVSGQTVKAPGIFFCFGVLLKASLRSAAFFTTAATWRGTFPMNTGAQKRRSHRAILPQALAVGTGFMPPSTKRVSQDGLPGRPRPTTSAKTGRTFSSTAIA